MQFLELTLVQLGELAFEKSGMRLPRRIARQWRERRILGDRHTGKEPCDVIGSGIRRSHRPYGDCPRRDLWILLRENAEPSRDD
jgi:hypothetical protein